MLVIEAFGFYGLGVHEDLKIIGEPRLRPAYYLFYEEASQRQALRLEGWTRLYFCQGGFQSILGDLLVVMVLEVEPNLCGPAEVAFETQGGIDRDGAFAFDDLVDAAWWNSDVFGETVFRESERDEEILAQNFAGVDG